MDDEGEDKSRLLVVGCDLTHLVLCEAGISSIPDRYCIFAHLSLSNILRTDNYTFSIWFLILHTETLHRRKAY